MTADTLLLALPHQGMHREHWGTIGGREPAGLPPLTALGGRSLSGHIFPSSLALGSRWRLSAGTPSPLCGEAFTSVLSPTLVRHRGGTAGHRSGRTRDRPGTGNKGIQSERDRGEHPSLPSTTSCSQPTPPCPDTHMKTT